MRIQINHVGKMEGHADFVAEIIKGNVKQAQFMTTEGARLIEGLLIGRHYTEAPIITARICGICPVVHNLTAIKAIETALGIKPTTQVVNLRHLMQYGQIIHSHGLHLFFLSLPDFFSLENDLDFVKKYPQEAQAAIRLRDFGLKLIQTIGGRAIHPIASEIGGFKVLPKKKELQEILAEIPARYQDAEKIFQLATTIKYTSLERNNEYFALHQEGEYAIFEGEIVSTHGVKLTPRNFSKAISEYQRPLVAAKYAEHAGHPFMVGALARLNLNHEFLHPRAKKLLRTLGWQLPVTNNFYNIIAQAIELTELLESSEELLKKILQRGLKPETSQAEKLKLINYANPRGKTTEGVGAIEAPRGTLYHHYRLNRDGLIEACDIITPTVQFLGNIEEDIKVYLPATLKLSDPERQIKIRALIRAYDPCISCATH